MVEYAKVLELKKVAEEHVGRMHRTMENVEQVYRLNFDIGIELPAGVPIHRPSTAPAKVDHFADQVRTVNPRVTLGPLGKGSRAETRRNNLEAFGSWVMEQTGIYEDDPVWDYVKFQMALLGASCVRVLFDESLWPDGDEDRNTAWPLRVRVVHPRNVLVSPGHRWPYAYVIETQERYVGEIREDYPDWRPMQDLVESKDYGRPTTPVSVVIYWDADTYAMFADGGKVMEKPNLLGVPPYAWSFSGLGHKAADGDPDAQAVGILKHSLSELSAEARLTTLADILWQLTVYPTLKGTLPAEVIKSAMSAGFGRYLELPEGADVDKALDWQEPPQVNQGMWAMLADLRHRIEQATYSDVLSGQQTGADYGVLYGMQVGQARLRVDSIKQSVERLAGRVVGLSGLYYSKVIRHAPKVGAHTVSLGDLEDFTDYRVKFEPVDPADNDRKIQTGLAMRQSRSISLKRFLRDYVKVERPQEEIEEMLVEQALDQMMAQGVLSQAIMQYVQGQEALGQAQQAVQTAESGLGGGAAPPQAVGAVGTAGAQLPAREGRAAPYGPREAAIVGTEGPSQSAKMGV